MFEPSEKDNYTERAIMFQVSERIARLESSQRDGFEKIAQAHLKMAEVQGDIKRALELLVKVENKTEQHSSKLLEVEKQAVDKKDFAKLDNRLKELEGVVSKNENAVKIGTWFTRSTLAALLTGAVAFWYTKFK